MLPVVTAGAGFLLAVLWFDLMFDVQVLRHPGPDVPEPVLASISRYYRRVTTDARPMNRLVALVMLVTVGAIAVQAGRHDVARWVSVASAVLALAPIILAGTRTVPSAVRLGADEAPPEVRSALARSICCQHLFCAVSIAALIAVQLIAA